MWQFVTISVRLIKRLHRKVGFKLNNANVPKKKRMLKGMQKPQHIKTNYEEHGAPRRPQRQIGELRRVVLVKVLLLSDMLFAIK